MFTPDSISDDAFLGGRLHLWQPRDGYRAASDAVLLAACCGARAGQSVLDLGCGVGAAALCLGARVPGLHLSGLEVQANYADLARRNTARTKFALEIFEGSVMAPPTELRRGFDHVITNPPYFRPEGTPAQDGGRDTAMREAVGLAEWLTAASRRLVPGGWLTMILRADRLGDALAGMQGRLGSVSALPLTARPGREAGRVVIRAKKGGRAGLRLLAPFILHDGPAHDGDRDNHSPEASAVFRQGADLCHLFA